MAIKDTFRVIRTWSAAEAVPFLESCLQEQTYEVQAGAFDLLTAPDGFARPELVVLHFDTLMPEVKGRVRDSRSFFLELGRKLIRGSDEMLRRASYKMLGEIGGAEVARDLAHGVDDASTLIRFNSAESLEKIAVNFHSHLISWSVRKDPSSRAFIDQNRKAMFEALPQLLRTWPLHRKDIFLHVAVESGSEVYGTVKEVALNHVGGPLWQAFIEAMQASSSDPMCDTLFRLYLDGGKFRDAAVQVMKHRRDPKFPIAVAEYLLHSPAERLGRLRALQELPFWGAVEANPGLPPSAAIPLLDFVSSADLAPKEREQAIKSMLSSRHAAVRIHVLRTFERLKVPYLAEVARDRLGDPADEVKLVACKLVAEHLPSQKARLLGPLLDTSGEEVRRVVLKEIADLSAARYATSFAGPEPTPRQLADRVAARIDPGTIDRLLEGIIALDPVRRLQALRLAEPGRTDRDIQPLVVDILQGEGSPLRPLLVQILAFSGSKGGLRMMLESLASRDLSLSSRIVEALQELHDVRLAALFLPFVADRDPKIRAAASKVVGTFGQQEASLLLAPLVAVGDERLRTAAVSAIAEMKIDGAKEMLEGRLAIEANEKVRETIRRVVGDMK